MMQKVFISLLLAFVSAGQPKGYAGLDSAHKMLNSMTFNCMVNYDGEIAKCTGFYSKQYAAMEAWCG